MPDRLDVMPVVLPMSDAIGIWIECLNVLNMTIRLIELVGMFVRWPGGVLDSWKYSLTRNQSVCVCVSVWLPAVDLWRRACGRDWDCAREGARDGA